MKIGYGGGLPLAQRKFLSEIGLSEDAVELYAKCLAAGKLTASQASASAGEYPSAQYRLFYRLEQYGLVREEKGWPKLFHVVPPQLSFPVALRTRKTELDDAAKAANKMVEERGEAGLRLLTGKEALYQEYAELAPQARHTIDLYTIGIAYSPELVAVQKAAVRKGVRIRHIVQEVKLSNLHVITTWQKLGVKLRKNGAERGFHLMTFDDTLAIASFSNPADTEDRLSLITENPSALAMFRRYFDSLWEASRELSL